MSSHTWTAEELSSSCISLSSEEAWRVVEAQHAASTMKLTDTLEEQQLLELLIDETKPPIPQRCKGLNFLLFSPFRYRPYPQASRFRQAGLTPGIFYCSQYSSTAICELAFYRLLFFAESPDTTWPKNPSEYTGFCVEFSATKVIDLRNPPFDRAKAAWEHLQDYRDCQRMEVACRAEGIETIVYKSVRDPTDGKNFALLDCGLFDKSDPIKLESWKMHLGRHGVRAVREFPPKQLEFDRSAFAADDRVASMVWDR